MQEGVLETCTAMKILKISSYNMAKLMSYNESRFLQHSIHYIKEEEEEGVVAGILMYPPCTYGQTFPNEISLS